MRSIRRSFRVVGGLCLLLVFTVIWLKRSSEKKYYQYSPCTVSKTNRSILATKRCIRKLPESSVLTAECPSRLGNQMFSYAILYAISIYNHRTAFMSPSMSNYISKYFEVSLGTLDDDLYEETTWELNELEAKVPTWLKNLKTTENIKFCCWPQSWKYFDEIRPVILQEFKFHDHVEKIAENELTIARKQFLRSDGPFVGVHVRRSDYLCQIKKIKYHLPSAQYYKGAMEYFKSKYSNPIFIIASDDIPWCRENFARFAGMDGFLIHYINGTSEEDGGYDLATLSKCDHMIFGMGTFGFWAAYLSPGEVVYCSDCLTKDSIWLTDPSVYGGNYSNFVLPSWKGMSRIEIGSNISSAKDLDYVKSKCLGVV